ncbi:hypothetical protein GCM10022252_29050 [Streptosporangium oxazolinicum]|uniref:Uncharacterized protein n=1 Tax=Streptosporangium oxazolinicum TaxID=909287 RepID=A0ABP8AU01_9ACTN
MSGGDGREHDRLVDLAASLPAFVVPRPGGGDGRRGRVIRRRLEAVSGTVLIVLGLRMAATTR